MIIFTLFILKECFEVAQEETWFKLALKLLPQEAEAKVHENCSYHMIFKEYWNLK